MTTEPNPAVPIPAVRRSLTVRAPADRAFRVFTAAMGVWWPREHTVAEVERLEVVMEPRPGGRWYERGVDGSECDWGRVLAYEPPARVLLAWHLNGDWRFEPDPERASEVEVTFRAEETGVTRVTLEHRHFERHGPGAGGIRDAVAAGGGWGGLLSVYAAEVSR